VTFVNCDQAIEHLQAIVDDDANLDPSAPASRHLGMCLRCQAEVAQFRRLRRAMLTTESRHVPAPSGFCGQVMAAIEAASDPFAVAQLAERAKRTKRRAMVAVGAMTAVAAGTAGVLVAATRRRSLALAPG
jgi:anti-sigma factor RsiW